MIWLRDFLIFFIMDSDLTWYLVRNGGFPEGHSVLKYIQLVSERDSILKNILSKVTTCFGARTYYQQSKMFLKIVIVTAQLDRLLKLCVKGFGLNEEFYEPYSVMNSEEIDTLVDLTTGLSAIDFEEPPPPENEDCSALQFGNSFVRKSRECLFSHDDRLKSEKEDLCDNLGSECLF